MFKSIHVNHIFTSKQETKLTKEQIIETWQEDAFAWFLVREQFGNHARVHLISAASQYDAISDVVEYLSEEEDDHPQILSAEQIRELFPTLS